jgi:hypothetical protein
MKTFSFALGIFWALAAGLAPAASGDAEQEKAAGWLRAAAEHCYPKDDPAGMAARCSSAEGRSRENCRFGICSGITAKCDNEEPGDPTILACMHEYFPDNAPAKPLPTPAARSRAGGAPSPGVRATASSSLPREKRTSYGPENVLDGNPKTAWCEGVEGNGEGEWLAVYTGRDGDADTAPFLSLSNGFQASAALRAMNGEASQWRVELLAGDHRVDELLVSGPALAQSIIFQKPLPPKANPVWVKLTIVKVRPGAKYQDTCISDIEVGFPQTGAMPDVDEAGNYR